MWISDEQLDEILKNMSKEQLVELIKELEIPVDYLEEQIENWRKRSK